MNINGIGNSPIGALLKADLSQSTTTQSDAPAAASGAAPTNISRPGELLQKLQQLEEQNPAQFKQVLSQLAAGLQQIADSSGNSNATAAKLAGAFSNAADTGDLSALQSALQPPNVATAAQAAGGATPASAATSANGAQGAQRHHHGHHHGGGGIAEAFSTAISQIDAALQSQSQSAPT